MAEGNIVQPDDSRLISQNVTFPGNAGPVKAYLSRPKDGKNLGTVIVIHENRGLVDHIKDVARRFAKEGFAALAVDLMSRIGGTDQFKTPEEAIEAIKKINGNMVVEDLTSAVAYLKKQNFLNGKVGVVGYCWGGGQSQLRDQVQGLERGGRLLRPQSRSARPGAEHSVPGDGQLWPGRSEHHAGSRAAQAGAREIRQAGGHQGLPGREARIQ